MYNPITKTLRYLRREYPEQTLFSGFFGLFGLGMGIGIGVSTGGLGLLAIPACSIGMGGFAGLFNMAGGGEGGRNGENTGRINGVKIVGSPRDVDSVLMTQRLITSITKKKQHMPELPPRTQRRIARHLKDIAPRLARLRVYDYAENPVGGFSFTREVVDARGRKTTQTIAAVATPMTGPEAPALPAAKPPLVLPAPEKTLPAPDLSAEFGTLARQVEKVEKRMDAIENPAHVTLDKPKLG
jgi:hypothetical protein